MAPTHCPSGPLILLAISSTFLIFRKLSLGTLQLKPTWRRIIFNWVQSSLYKSSNGADLFQGYHGLQGVTNSYLQWKSHVNTVTCDILFATIGLLFFFPLKFPDLLLVHSKCHVKKRINCMAGSALQCWEFWKRTWSLCCFHCFLRSCGPQHLLCVSISNP